MLGKQAKILTPSALNQVLLEIGKRRTAHRDRVVVLLSVRAGLRACEIAKLNWSMVLNAEGQVGEVIDVRADIAKRRSGRRVPLHSQLRDALVILQTALGPARTAPNEPVIRSKRGTHMKPNSIVNWFVALFRDLGIEGCSSHSGRRTFITNAARKLHHAGASLRDVQILAGHRSIETTQGYIDGQSAAQRKLVNLV